MSDQGVLFGFSVVMVIGAIVVAVLIGISGHISFDEVFLLAACAVTAFAFGAYVVYLLRQASLAATSIQAPTRTTTGSMNAAERRPAA